MDLSDDNVNQRIREEKLELCVVSYGGCGSNSLVKGLCSNGINCTTGSWHALLCHCPRKVNMIIPMIYIYRDPVKAFLSMRRRGHGYYTVNQQKLSNNLISNTSDENLLSLMISQFYSWTNQKSDNVLILKYDELFSIGIEEKLEAFLNRKLLNFPIQYIAPFVDDDVVMNLNTQDKVLFNKYKKDIDHINLYQ